MRLFDPKKWERVRAKGRRRFILDMTLKYFFVAGILIVSLNLWSIHRINRELPWHPFTLQPFIWMAVLFAFIVFPLGGIICARLVWYMNERFYRRHTAILP